MYLNSGNNMHLRIRHGLFKRPISLGVVIRSLCTLYSDRLSLSDE